MSTRAAMAMALAAGLAAVSHAQAPGPPGATTYLRWPHEPAGLSDAERTRLRESVFILNNYGLYQAGDTPDSVYFHDGLDVMLPNGTPLYAIASGHVRWISGTVPYRQVMVEDADRPGWAWQYVHVDRVPFRVGDFVADGAQLAVVNFQGVEHVHLNRVSLAENGQWDDIYALNFVQSIAQFEFLDNEPPTIETPFRYFINETDAELRNGGPTLVSGEIDIVAGMRDGGRYAHGRVGRIGQYGDRLAPQRAEVSIARAADPAHIVWSNVAFDFSKLTLGFRPGLPLRDPDRVFTLFKYRPLVETSPPGNYNRVFAYYVLTNRGSSEDETRRIAVEDGLPSWNTAARDAEGRARFTDGEYIVTVTAWDAKGNRALAQDRVIVANR